MSDEMSTADSAEVVDSVESTADLETTGPEEARETGAEAVDDTEGTGEETIEEDEPKSTGKHRLKVRGKEIEVDDDKLYVLAQQGAAAGEQLREAAQLRKQLEEQAQWVERLKSADVGQARKMLREVGLDVRGLSEAEIMDLIAEEQLSPEERKIREYEAKLAEYEAHQEQLRQQHEQKQLQAETERAQQEYAEAFEAALAETGLEATPHRLARMAFLAHSALENDIEADPAQLAQAVAEEHRGDIGAHLDSLEVDQLIELIGPERMKAIRQRDIERVNASKRPGKRSNGASRQRQPEKLFTVDDFMERLEAGDFG